MSVKGKRYSRSSFSENATSPVNEVTVVLYVKDLRRVIASFVVNVAAGVDEIKSLVLNGARKHKTFDKLAELSDKYPDRNSGSQGLEDAIG